MIQHSVMWELFDIVPLNSPIRLGRCWCYNNNYYYYYFIIIIIIIIIIIALGTQFPRAKKLMQIVKLYTSVLVGRKLGRQASEWVAEANWIEALNFYR